MAATRPRSAAALRSAQLQLLLPLLLPSLLLLLLLLPVPADGTELTFELKDNAKQCFYEEVQQGARNTLDYQVITGGNYDVDCRVEGPTGEILYKEMRKQYDSHVWTAEKKGIYAICFSNEFSTFSHKTVYFDWQIGDEKPVGKASTNGAVSLTQMESACVTIHEALKSVISYQTHHRLEEAQDRYQAEHLNSRVTLWSVGETLMLLSVVVGQVMLLKSFFADKHTGSSRVGL
ncbi:transmembrane emp24 domain-containing protein 7-like [Lampetra fluviatilis]